MEEINLILKKLYKEKAPLYTLLIIGIIIWSLILYLRLADFINSIGMEIGTALAK